MISVLWFVAVVAAAMAGYEFICAFALADATEDQMDGCAIALGWSGASYCLARAASEFSAKVRRKVEGK